MKSDPDEKGAPSLSPRFLRRQGGDFDFALKRSNVVIRFLEPSREAASEIQPTQAVGEKRKDARAGKRRKKFSVTTPPSDNAAAPAPADTHTPPVRSRSRPASAATAPGSTPQSN